MAATNGTTNGAAAKLIDIKSPPTELLIGGKFAQGRGEVLPLGNPKDGSKLSFTVHSASEEDVDTAVKHAREAFETGPWASYTGEERGKVLNKLADLIDAHVEQLAYLESLASGRPLGMLLREFPRVASTFRYYAGWADKIKGDSFPAEDGFYKIVRHEAIGVCAGIYAWNASGLFFSWKSAPALACGNTTILKCSEKSPLGTLALAKLVHEAGFPPGVFQIVVGRGDVGAMLSSHMDIDKISFTGSTFTGKKIQDAAMRSNMKRVTLELGGKSPALVFKDADINKALFWCMIGITANSGQVCAATSRLFVAKEIAEEFTEKLKASFQEIASSLGADPQEKTTSYGPLVDELQYEKVMQYIQEGKKTNKVLTGGEEFKNGGYYVAPTIFIDPDKSSNIYKEEIFGPVLCLQTFETEAEAIKLANDTEYGLAGAVFTQDINTALRVSGKVRGGTICINCNVMVGTQVPMGGFGSSGVGRELGEYALKQYTETKSIWINMV